MVNRIKVEGGYTMLEISLLFSNKILERNAFVCTIYELKKDKGIFLKDLLFYYSLAIFRTTENQSLEHIYTKIRKEVNDMLLYLINTGFVKIIGLNTLDILLSKVVVTELGKNYVENLESFYFMRIREEVKLLKKEYPVLIKNNFIEVGMYDDN